MRRYYLAESLKNRHTYIGILIILMPLLNVCLAAGLTADYFTIDSYNWWYIALFPGMLALIGSALGNRDKKMGNRAIWVLPADMGSVWDGKVLYGIRCMGISLSVLLAAVLCISTGLEQILQKTFVIEVSAGRHILAVGVLFITSLWQIPFCLLLQQIFGTFPMVLLHIGSYIVLGVELSLCPYFMVFPGGITARLMCIILKILPNGLVAESGSMTFTPELLEWKGFWPGVLASLIWFLGLWAAGRRWFQRQVER